MTHPGSKEPLPNAEAGAVPSLASVSYFTQKLVEKIYSGVFSADPRHILLFITEHIIAVRSCVPRAIRSIPWMDWESPSASLIFLF